MLINPGMSLTPPLVTSVLQPAVCSALAMPSPNTHSCSGLEPTASHTHTTGSSILSIRSTISQNPLRSDCLPGVLLSSLQVTATPTLGPSEGVTDWMAPDM